jgi:hypothetical protein
LFPVQSPEATHELALLDDHDSDELPPLANDAGVAVNVTVGAGAGVTVIDAEALPLLPAPMQVRK